MNAPRPIRVLFPESGRENPYLELLTAALRQERIEVVHAPRLRHFALWRAVWRTGRPDILHLQWQHGYFTARNLPFAALNSVLLFTQWAVLRLLNVRLVWTVHELVNHQQWQARWERFASRLLARVVDAVVVHSYSAAEIVAREYGLPAERIHVTPHGNYIGRYPEVGDARAARARLGMNGSGPLLLFFGALRRHKGVAGLLRAFRAIEHPAARLVIAGEPESADIADELVSLGRADERVALRLEYVDDQTLAQHLAACDYVVLPHVSVLTSGSAILAASAARAPVMPRLGCMREFPTDAAVLFDPEDERGLEDALRRALATAPDRLGAAARAYIEPFTWARCAHATVAVYRSVLRRG